MSPPPLHIHPKLPILLDPQNRHVLLRGVNLSGDAKYPLLNPRPDSPDFYDVSKVTYTGRPFSNLTEAREWLPRFQHWGINIIRLVVVWEALEPCEMGVYDEEYISYIAGIVKLCDELGIYVVIDGHQDCWSRFTGGSGAPLWTFNLVGLDPRKFRETHGVALDPEGKSTPLSTPSSRLWPTNYTKFPVATMFTLFFGGEVFAPHAVYDGPVEEFRGKNVGEVLRTAFTRAHRRLMERIVEVGAEGAVLGVDPLNEPHPGYIGLDQLDKWDENTDLHVEWMPSPVEGMSLANGKETEIGYWKRSWPVPSYRSQRTKRNSSQTSAYLTGAADIWAREGVYDPDTGKVLKPEYFKRDDAHFDILYTDFLSTFYASLKSLKPSLHLFLEPLPNSAPAPPLPANAPRSSVIFSPHWYDIRVLFEKALWPNITFDVLSLARGSRNFLAHTYFSLTSNYTTNLTRLSAPHPTSPLLIGETGVPVDLNKQSYYHHPRGHEIPERMLDSLCTAMERNLYSWALWNITIPHSHTHPFRGYDADVPPPSETHDNDVLAPVQSGDGWNSEDFSLVSLAPLPLTAGVDREGRYKGLRLKRAFVRPYPLATVGVLTGSGFEKDKERRFWMEYDIGGAVRGGKTEVFAPRLVWGGCGDRGYVEVVVWVDGREVVREKVGDGDDGGEKDGVKWSWSLIRERLEVEVVGGGKVKVEVRAVEVWRGVLAWYFGW